MSGGVEGEERREEEGEVGGGEGEEGGVKVFLKGFEGGSEEA